MRLALMTIALGSLAPTAAEACRINPPPHIRMAGVFDGVVVGVVENPRLRSRGEEERPGWQAEVRVTRVVEGRSRLARYSIGRTGDPAACDDGQPMPTAGEAWVVYLTTLPGDRADSATSYPLALARQADLRFRSRSER